MSSHELGLKIYLEDTDAQGIVYHANYLKYCERARTELLGARGGMSLGAWQARGYIFVAHEMNIKWKEPARLHDEVIVRTTMEQSSPYRLTFKHLIYRRRDDALLVKADIGIVVVGSDGNLRELPAELVGEERGA